MSDKDEAGIGRRGGGNGLKQMNIDVTERKKGNKREQWGETCGGGRGKGTR